MAWGKEDTLQYLPEYRTIAIGMAFPENVVPAARWCTCFFLLLPKTILVYRHTSRRPDPLDPSF